MAPCGLAMREPISTGEPILMMPGLKPVGSAGGFDDLIQPVKPNGRDPV